MFLQRFLLALGICSAAFRPMIAQLPNLPASPVATGVIPASLVLNGTATWTLGSTHDSGSLILHVKSSGAVEEDWNLPKLSRVFKQSGFDGDGTCQFIDDAGKVTVPAGQLCTRTVPWFAPWLALKSLTDGNSVEVESTSLTDKAAGLNVFTFTPALPDLSHSKPRAVSALRDINDRSAVRVSYDGKTALPTRMDFSDYPDSDPSRKIDTYVLFSDYRLEQGIMIPHHLQRYVQRTLQLDVNITSVSTN